MITVTFHGPMAGGKTTAIESARFMLNQIGVKSVSFDDHNVTGAARDRMTKDAEIVFESRIDSGPLRFTANADLPPFLPGVLNMAMAKAKKLSSKTRTAAR